MKVKESVEQVDLMKWAEYQSGKYPELELLHHIPNGGSRNKLEAYNLKLQGVKSGVPDLCLPVARGGYHGLYIEMKVKPNKPSAHQKKWIENLSAQGYKAVVCYGWEEAAQIILDYMQTERTTVVKIVK